MLTITTYDWVPEFPRGWVRDLRVAWAAEEAGLPYGSAFVPLSPKSPDHVARQPFGQVPVLQDGAVTLFESGACVLHIAEQSEALMPRDPAGRAAVLSWIFAALNTVEPVLFYQQLTTHFDAVPEAAAKATPRLQEKLGDLEAAFGERQFVAAGRFTAADILLGDVLRSAAGDELLAGHPRLAAYVERLTARPAFRKVHAEQLARFAAAEARRARVPA